MSANNSNNATATATDKVATALAAFKASRGIPTWKSVGIDRADVVAVLVENGESVVKSWQENTGALAKLPTSLLKDAVNAFMMTDAATMETVKAMMTVCIAGQASETGDTLTDNAATAGKLAGERIAALTLALSILKGSVPAQVSKSGEDRVKAYKASRDAKHDPNMETALKVVGSVVNGNTALAGTYGKETAWIESK